MRQRIQTIIRHPLTALYIGALILAEVLNFALLDFVTASGLWFPIFLLWMFAPLPVALIRNVLRKEHHEVKPRDVGFFLLGTGLIAVFVTLGLLYAFDHHFGRRTFVFTRTSIHYAGRGRDYLLTTSDGTTYEADSPTGDGFDYIGFWEHVDLGAAYQCKTLSSPSLNYTEVYDCTQTGSAPPATATSRTTVAPTTSALVHVTFTSLTGEHASLELYLPGNAAVSTKDNELTITVGDAVVSGDVLIQACPEAMKALGSAPVIREPGGVLRIATDTGTVYGRTLGANACLTLTDPLPAGTGPTLDLAGIVAHSSGSVGG